MHSLALVSISEKLEDASVIVTRQQLTESIVNQVNEKASLPFKEFHTPKILPLPPK